MIVHIVLGKNVPKQGIGRDIAFWVDWSILMLFFFGMGLFFHAANAGKDVAVLA